MVILNHLVAPDQLKGIRGVIFDCDGVMVDSYDANTYYYNLFKKAFGLPEMDDREKAYVHAHNVYESIAHILPKDKLDEAYEMRKGIDYRDMITRSKPEKGLYRLVHWLKANGFGVAVNTNRNNTMEMLLDHLGLTECFFPVMTTAKVSSPKPHPEGVYRILTAWDIKPWEAVYIGDSDLDQITARASGTRFLAYKNESLEADLHVPDLVTLWIALKKLY